MAAEAEQGGAATGGVSPTDKTSMQRTIERSLGAMNSNLTPRADPDAQTTVTDFLDFTEYLPSDTIRSLTLIGNLDQAYTDASVKVDELTTTWGQLPSIAPAERPSPVKLRADISEKLNRAVSSRVFAHAEAVRMSENIHRHYNKATVLLSKLQAMMENYPTEEQKSPVTSRSPQLARAKLTVRAGGEGGSQKTRRQRVPRITVPGEVLAPYDIEYDTFSDDSDSSSDDESDVPTSSRRTPAPAPRIKLVNKTPKSTSRPPRPPQTPVAATAAAAANAAALLQPPPENAVIGSQDAPWLQLTDYELAKLRKRMKKNATWTPSETMVARELKLLDRGPEAYREAKKKAEDEGKEFEPTVPAAVAEDESSTPQLPAGAISMDSLATEDVPTSNRGMKLNEAKKLKRETLAKLAAEEAEESARKMAEQAKVWLGSRGSDKSKDASSNRSRSDPRSNTKRKRDAESDTNDAQDGEETPTPTSVPQIKRTKTETPVPPPQHITLTRSSLQSASSEPAALLTPGGTANSTTPQLETPVPIPIPPQGSSSVGGSRSVTSPTPAPATTNTVTTSVPIKPPATETPVPLPVPDRRKSATPATPPMRETPVRETNKRETRGDAAKRTQPPQQTQQNTPELTGRRSSSRGATPRGTPGPDGHALRRPGSRGKAMSQEPQPSTAVDRPRRASTARNTPAPEARQPYKRPKRPAPGVVSTTSSGGNTAVGRRKAPPKRKARLTKKDKGQMETEMEEVDDEGNPISLEEPRYCICNRVSFGTMIQCDNVENCKQEWFHLDCVGLSNIPARTTKWYCPDCRKLLNLGEKGEVSARGVRK